MKRILFILSFLPCMCVADWFEPSTYEDCIIQAMKGTTSDTAAQEIKKACRIKHPLASNLETRGQKITGLAASQTLNRLKFAKTLNFHSKIDADHKLEFHNSLNFWVTSITIQVQIDNNNPLFYKATTQARPLASGFAYFNLGLPEKSKVAAWKVYEIEFSEKDPRAF